MQFINRFVLSVSWETLDTSLNVINSLISFLLLLGIEYDTLPVPVFCRKFCTLIYKPLNYVYFIVFSVRDQTVCQWIPNVIFSQRHLFL